MNNQRVTYEELNLHKDWKRRQKEPQDSKSSDAVTEQEITYAELNFQNSCQDPQGNDQQHHSRALLEKFIAGSLVLLCLVWMIIIIIVIPSTENQESKNSSLVAMTQKVYNCNHCPEEWFMYSNSCYYISNEKRTWNESMMSCVSKKSKLLYIDNPEEMPTVTLLGSWPHLLLTAAYSQYRTQSPPLSSSEMRRQRENDPQLNLESRRQLMKDFPLPPEQLTAEVLGITCLVLLSTLGKTIILISYAEIERPELNNASLVTRTQEAYNCNHCPEEWFIHSNSCYYISNEKRTWSESMMSCVSKNSKLLYIDNPEEMNIFVAFDILPWSGPFNETNDGVQIRFTSSTENSEKCFYIDFSRK